MSDKMSTARKSTGERRQNSNVVRLTIPGMRYVKRPAGPPANEFTAANVAPKDLPWVWYPRIPGGINLIGAPGGTGKGLLCTNLVSIVTKERRWPLSDEEAFKRNVLWCETEDSFEAAVVPRLIAAGADRSRVILKKPDEFFGLNLRAYIDEHDLGLIVLSPLNSFLKSLKNPNDGRNVRNVMEKLIEEVEDTDCAVIGICHTNKKADLAAIERLLGSVEYVNAARSVLLLRKEPEDEHLVRVIHAKSNYAPKADDLLFRSFNTEPDKHPRGQYIAIRWEKPDENIDASSAYDRTKDNDDDVPSAREWLFEHLQSGTWELISDVFGAAEKSGHRKSAIRKAKQRSAGKIEHKPENGKPTHWRLVPEVGQG
jgi:hypothetical protein